MIIGVDVSVPIFVPISMSMLHSKRAFMIPQISVQTRIKEIEDNNDKVCFL